MPGNCRQAGSAGGVPPHVSASPPASSSTSPAPTADSPGAGAAPRPGAARSRRRRTPAMSGRRRPRRRTNRSTPSRKIWPSPSTSSFWGSADRRAVSSTRRPGRRRSHSYCHNLIAFAMTIVWLAHLSSRIIAHTLSVRRSGIAKRAGLCTRPFDTESPTKGRRRNKSGAMEGLDYFVEDRVWMDRTVIMAYQMWPDTLSLFNLVLFM